MIDVPLPSLGADMDEGTLLEWRVAPGDVVHKGQVLAVVDTTKAALDVESWHEGTVDALLVEAGRTIPVGTPILRLAVAGEAATPVAPPGAHRRPHISPAARRRAAELGIDLARVTAAADGTIRLQDVERAAAAGAATVREAQAAPPPARTPVTAQRGAAVPAESGAPAPATDRAARLRGTIAAAMSRAKREVPHYYLGEEVALGPALDWLAAQNATRPPATRILPAALYVRAVALAAREHRDFNGWHTEGEFHAAGEVHVGVAIALRGGGLLAPAIMHADEKPLDTLMTELRDLISRARAGSLQRRELTDATITLTHLGEGGVQQVYGIVYAPQVALVGVGGIAVRPWVAGERVVPERTAWLTLSADHRVTDGHAGSRFLAAVAARLRDPAAL
jgi:pyruvate dehydrogenase E2 component (dihydrolipoamide acetyltransferase)